MSGTLQETIGDAAFDQLTKEVAELYTASAGIDGLPTPRSQDDDFQKTLDTAAKRADGIVALEEKAKQARGGRGA